MDRIQRSLLLAPILLGSTFACSSEHASNPEGVDAAAPIADGGTLDATSSCGQEGAPSGFVGRRSLRAGDRDRSYLADVPRGHDGRRRYPLVVVFHGYLRDGAEVRERYDFASFAGEEAIFLYPDADRSTWDVDDVAVFDALLAEATRTWCVDEARVFATGPSYGGALVNELGCRRGDKLRGIAPRGSFGPSMATCPTAPVAAFVTHARDDALHTFDDGVASKEHWRTANGCAASSTAHETAPCVRYDGCARPVVWCDLGNLGGGIWADGARATWSFFRAL